MALDGINGVQGNNQVYKTDSVKKADQSKSSELIKMTSESKIAKKKITKQDTEQALNEPRTGKAVLGLLEKSPVGLGNQQTKEEITNLGYTFAGTAYYPGAPVIYNSHDGGTITVYDGRGSSNMGENIRKTVYENGNYKQEMFYDADGKLKKCDIRIKSEVTGLTEPNGRFTMFYNEEGKQCFIR